jgi:hypothetical protein
LPGARTFQFSGTGVQVHFCAAPSQGWRSQGGVQTFGV